jgi:hypothetical protein
VRKAVAAALTGAVVAGALVIAAPRNARADDGEAAQELLEQSRHAAAEHEFTGTIEVEWRDGRARKSETVEVEAEDGVLHLGETHLAGAGDRRMMKTEAGWQLLWAAPPKGEEPEPTGKYRFDLVRRTTVAGRPATLVAIRRDGSDAVRERLSFDDATGMLLRREQLDERGRPTRRFSFVELSAPVALEGTTDTLPKATKAAPAVADALPDAPEDLVAPKRIGRGFVLSGVYAQADGSVQLYYSDGLLGVSVFERAGDLDWSALPAGGRTVELMGKRARLYTTVAGTAVVWTKDDITFTSVSDAPMDELAAIAEDLDEADDPGLVEEVGRFITQPFSWG